MQIPAYTRNGKICGEVTVVDRSKKGQRCVSYVNYKSAKKVG